MIMAVGNMQTKEEEKLIQKYLALLRYGEHNLRAFHKQENSGPGGQERQARTAQPAAMEGAVRL